MCFIRAKPNVWLESTVQCYGILLILGTARKNEARLRVTEKKLSVTDLFIN